jgi:2-amino-4-hydroxy-6-hydroxymethyldihydropteridine diphosphokinase
MEPDAAESTRPMILRLARGPSAMDNEKVQASAVLGLGSNLGDREAAIAGAIAGLEALGFRRSRLSSLYLTQPVGGPPQGDFLNAVAAGETDLAPEQLLACCLTVERELGRVRAEPNGPRTIDVDILFMGALRRDGPPPVLPHPRLHLRRFVLEPLAEILPDLVHPAFGKTVAELLRDCADPSSVRRFAEARA